MNLRDLIDTNRIPVFVCVGSMLNMADSIAPRIGTKLETAGFAVIGTEKNPLNALNLEKRYAEEIDLLDSRVYQIIPIDCTIHDSSEPFQVWTQPMKPRSGVAEHIMEIGEFYVGCEAYYWTKMNIETKKTMMLLDSMDLHDNVPSMVLNQIHKTTLYILDELCYAYGDKMVKAIKCASMYLYCKMNLREIEEIVGFSRASVWNYMNKRVFKNPAIRAQIKARAEYNRTKRHNDSKQTIKKAMEG